MAKKPKEASSGRLWDGVDDNTFLAENNTEQRDIGDYNKEKMALFALNINCARQLFALEDSLKPVERRILYVMYLQGAHSGKKRKSSEIMGPCLRFHPHGDGSVYQTMVNMAQSFKRSKPMIRGIGNFGSSMNPDKFAHYRYTEVSMSDYAYECFFDDYDPECIEMQRAANMVEEEPVFLPGKFPNILVNGAIAISFGYNSAVPPYNIDDIIKVTKRLIKNPEDRNFVIIPDMPTGCDIVDDGSFRQICETGEGTLKMRGHIEIEDAGDKWILKVSSIPWLTGLNSIQEKIKNLTKSGEIPIKDTRNSSYAVKVPNSKYNEVDNVIDFSLFMDKAYDPYAVRQKLYKKGGLEKTISVKFHTVHEGLKVDRFGMPELILAWLDSRREYLRRLYNKKNVKLTARISLLDILIDLTKPANLQKVVKIAQSATAEEFENHLMTKYGMNSYQAKKIADMPLRTWNKGSNEKFIAERDDLVEKRNRVMEIIRSEKKIDEIILADLDDLKKYGSPRKSAIVSADSSYEIMDSQHIMIISQKGYIKKLPIQQNTRVKGYGSFSAGDYPIKRITIGNREDLCFFDSQGKYSVIPVHQFSNTSPKDPGERHFKTTRLEGNIVSVFPAPTSQDIESIKNGTGKDCWMITLTKGGTIKRTNIDEYISYKVSKSVRGIRLKEGDSLIDAQIIMDGSILMIYTKMGNYTVIEASKIPLMGRDTQGVSCVSMSPGDEVAGFCVMNPKSTHVCVLTAKGCMKKIAMDSMGIIKKRKDTAYLTTLNNDDYVYQVETIREKDFIYVVNRQSMRQVFWEEIPEVSRRAKCTKVIGVPIGDNIINMVIQPTGIAQTY